jgi:hypothetical protein
MSDSALAGALHQKFYSDMPQAEFNAKIGLSAPVKTSSVNTEPTSAFGVAFKKDVSAPSELQKQAAGFVKGSIIDPMTAIGNLGVATALKSGLIDENTARSYVQNKNAFLHQYEKLQPGKVAEFVGGMAIPTGKVDNVRKMVNTGALMGGGYASATAEPTDEDYFSKVLGGTITGAITSPLAGKVMEKGAETISGLARRGYEFAGKTAPQIVQALGTAKNKVILKAAEGQEAALANKLAAAKSSLPGYQETASEAASSLGLTRLAGLQAEVSRNAAATTPYKGRELQQNETLKNALGSIARTPEERAKAVAFRDAQSKPLYKAFGKEIIESNPELEAFLDTTFGRAAVKRAKNVLGIDKTTTQIGQNIPAQQVASSLLDAAGNPIMTTIPAQKAKYTGEFLDAIGHAMSGEIKEKATKGLDPKEKEKMVAARNAYLAYLEEHSPDTYGKARELFRKNSEPINQMDIGKVLYESLVPAKGGISHSAFATAVRNAGQTVKKSIGDARFGMDEIKDVLTPGQLKIVYGTLEQLEKRNLSKELASAGTKGVSPMAETTPASNIPHFISAVLAFANTLRERSQNKMSDKVAKELAIDMLYPEKFAGAVATAIKGKGVRKQILQTTGKTVPVGMGVSSLSERNALAPDNQNSLSQ